MTPESDTSGMTGMSETPSHVLHTELPAAGGLDRNIALELCRVTEAAALASARWMGRGDKNALDQAAVNAMRDHLRVVEMDGGCRDWRR